MKLFRFSFLLALTIAFIAMDLPEIDPRIRDLPVGYRIQSNGIWKYDGGSRIHRGIYDLEGSY